MFLPRQGEDLQCYELWRNSSNVMQYLVLENDVESVSETHIYIALPVTSFTSVTLYLVFFRF